MTTKPEESVPMYPYYDMCVNPHLFFSGFLDYTFSFLVENRRDIKYHCTLSSPIRKLAEFGRAYNGKIVQEILAALPVGGFNYVINALDENRDTLAEDVRDTVIEFKSITKHPVVVATIGCLVLDFGSPQLTAFSFICSYDQKEAEDFLKAYYTWYKRIHKSSVLNHRGLPMPRFRHMKWESIFLPGNTLSDIRKDVEGFFGSEKLYTKHNIDWRLGLLLSGPPGNGKTAVCRAIATTAQVPVIYCSLDEDAYSILSSLQRTVSEYSPCILIIEDADALGSDDISRANFLGIMDGLFSAKGVLTIASTNHPEKLDPAITERPSRFDSYYAFPNPGPNEREKILLDKLDSIRLTKNQISYLIRETRGFSAAFVQEVAINSLRISFLSKKRNPTFGDVEKSLQKVKAHMQVAEEGIDSPSQKTMGFNQQTEEN